MFTITSVVPSFYMVSSLFLLPWPLLCASALHLGVHGELGRSPSIKRDHISGLENGRNMNYMTNITLGGQPFQVLIDTGRYPSSSFFTYDMLTYICLYQLRSLGFEYNSKC